MQHGELRQVLDWLLEQIGERRPIGQNARQPPVRVHADVVGIGVGVHDPEARGAHVGERAVVRPRERPAVPIAIAARMR